VHMNSACRLVRAHVAEGFGSEMPRAIHPPALSYWIWSLIFVVFFVNRSNLYQDGKIGGFIVYRGAPGTDSSIEHLF